MVRELRDLGPMEVIYHRAGSAGSRLGPADIDAARAAIEGARWLHLTGITPALSPGAAAALVRAKELARGAGVSVSLDLNIRRRLWTEADAAITLRALLDGVDLVLGGLDEVALVGGLAGTLEQGGRCDPVEAADRLLAAGARRVVVKLGADGALLRDGGGTAVRREGGRADALDRPEVVGRDRVPAVRERNAREQAEDEDRDGETLHRIPLRPGRRTSVANSRPLVPVPSKVAKFYDGGGLYSRIVPNSAKPSRR